MDTAQLAVVVGAGGMGAAVARTLAADYRILLVDIDERRYVAVAGEMREEGARVDTAQCDITSPEAVTALAERVGREGGVRVLAHVAGLSPTMGDFDSIIRVNLTGPALMSDALLPHAVPGAGDPDLLFGSAPLRVRRWHSEPAAGRGRFGGPARRAAPVCGRRARRFQMSPINFRNSA